MKFTLKRVEVLLPSIYLLGAMIVWIDFSRLPPDGLANVGIALYTLPDFFVVRFITGREFPFFEGGYYLSHALYFSVSVIFNAILLFIIINIIQKLFRKRSVEEIPR